MMMTAAARMVMMMFGALQAKVGVVTAAAMEMIALQVQVHQTMERCRFAMGGKHRVLSAVVPTSMAARNNGLTTRVENVRLVVQMMMGVVPMEMMMGVVP